MKTEIWILTLIIGLLYSCSHSSEKDTVKVDTNLGTIITSKDYQIAVLPIDSITFFQATDLAIRTRNKVISHPNQIKKDLPQSVILKENTYNNVYLTQINFTEGGVYQTDNEYPFIKSYYPELSILTCEGGHASDLIFNLKNGLTEESIGDPDTYVTSPHKRFQLASYYNGQMPIFFIQHRTKNGFEKIIPLQDILEEHFKSFLVGYDVKWVNDSTLLIYDKPDEYDEFKEMKDTHFQITILSTNENAVSTNHFRNCDYNAFIPSYVEIIDSVKGDIDGDGTSDVILITRITDPGQIYKNEYGEQMNTNNRGLIITLRKGQEYQLITKKPFCFAPFQQEDSSYNNELAIEIKNKQVHIDCYYGRFGGTECTFSFHEGQLILDHLEQVNIELGMVTSSTKVDFDKKEYTTSEVTNAWEVVNDDKPASYFKEKSKIASKRKITLAEISSFEDLDLSTYYTLLP